MEKVPNELTATEAIAAIASGEITAEDLACACLARIAEREPEVHAFAWIDRERALAEARERDAVDRSLRGRLHGLPMGVKDIIDTHDMPTECGSPIYAGHRPPNDASCVALAREAGAVMLGKTVTTEFALRHPGPTANPHDLSHTPGGSSSGSAAAVADFMVPVAFGTQTGGSIIRPASYCGVVGYKPSFNTINPTGVKPLATSYDTVGVIARSVDDCALVVDVLSGGLFSRSTGTRRKGERPGDMPRSMSPPLESLKPSRMGLCRTHAWHDAEPATVRAVESAADALTAAGVAVDEIELPDDFAGFLDAQADVLRYDAARVFAFERTRHRELLSASGLKELDYGWALPRPRYLEAQALIARCRVLFAEAIAPFDCLLSAAAAGEAPRGLHDTGEAMFNRLTSGLHVPCITLPGFSGPNGLPVGIQLIGGFGDDARLLSVAGWMEAGLPGYVPYSGNF